MINADRYAKNEIGWPFFSLRPTDSYESLAPFHGVMLSLLAGSWLLAGTSAVISLCWIWTPEIDQSIVYALHRPISPTWNSTETVGLDVATEIQDLALRIAMGGLLFANLVIGVVAIGRLGIYLNGGHLPPISLWGRLRTGRLIIPKYDAVFLAPLVALLAGFAVFLIGVSLGINPLYFGPVEVIITLMILLIMGPKLKEWQLTAPCRIANTLKLKPQSANQQQPSTRQTTRVEFSEA